MEETSYSCFYYGKVYDVVTDGQHFFIIVDGVPINVNDLTEE